MGEGGHQVTKLKDAKYGTTNCQKIRNSKPKKEYTNTEYKEEEVASFHSIKGPVSCQEGYQIEANNSQDKTHKKSWALIGSAWKICQKGIKNFVKFVLLGTLDKQ